MTKTMKPFHLFLSHPAGFNDDTMDRRIGSFASIEEAEAALAAYGPLSEKKFTHARLYRADPDGGELVIWRHYGHHPDARYRNQWRTIRYDPEHKGEQYEFLRSPEKTP